MYLCVVAIDGSPTAYAIRRTLITFVASLVIMVLLPLCEIDPTMPALSYKRSISVVSAFVLNRLPFCV